MQKHNIFKSIVLFLCTFFLSNQAIAQSIKEVDLAGSWYSSDPKSLKLQIENYFKKASIPLIEGEVIALVSPHAGIDYSGQVAAYGFAAIRNKKINTVVLIGFSHKKDYDGIAVFDKDGIKTPLGVLYTDKDLLKKVISEDKKIFPRSSVFIQENSVELILPFIQVALGNPKILLLAIGRQSLTNSQILAESLFRALGDRDNFIIIGSTDMSHYLPRSKAKEIDSQTAKLIEDMQPEKLFSKCAGQNRMCGLGPVVSTMLLAKKMGANKTYILDKAVSQSVGGQDRVVGYLSAAFVKSVSVDKKESRDMEELLNHKQKKELLELARKTIEVYLKEGKIFKPEITDDKLKEVMGVFVTLHKGSQLRGCIGNIVGTKPLYLGVRDMAIASATQDPRFGPLKEDELEDISLEISALSPLKEISSPENIILGTHGVLVKDGFRSGVYLPQVATETGWTKKEFMNSLCAQKAGMAADAWKIGQCQIFIFTAEVFGE